MTYSFYLPKLEIRTKQIDGVPNYIIKGYATVPEHIYSYKKVGDKSFKEFFSDKCLKNIKNKIKTEKVFVDAEHIVATKHSSDMILDDIKKRAGIDVSQEVNYIKNRLKYSDVPMFKVQDINIDDKGLFVEIAGNPYYRDIDYEHKAYFDSIWGSLETGFINGMSFNFKPTSTLKINDELTQIDDIDLYGISLTGSPANEMATITEVAMRSIEYVGGNEKCLKKKKLTTTSLLM